MKTLEFIVKSEDSGLRLDTFVTLKLSPAVSRNMVKKLIVGEAVRVNSLKAKPSRKVTVNDIILVKLPESDEAALTPLALPLNIVFEDDEILVIDKPAGLSVHPGAGNKNNTLANALIAYTSKLSLIDPKRPGIVHRLDKDTSGLLVVARNSQAHLNLIKQFKDRIVEKTYVAIVEGEVQFDEGRIDAPIAPDPRQRERMKVDFSSVRPALTVYKVLKRSKDFSVVELSPHTGRTHQLRVHMKYLGHPIVGDKKYSSRIRFSRMCLHAKRLAFLHPKSAQRLEFESELPKEFKDFLNEEFANK